MLAISVFCYQVQERVSQMFNQLDEAVLFEEGKRTHS
jgi:hypothetical protein